MYKKSATLFVFCLFVVLSISIFAIAKIPFLSVLSAPVTFVTSPLQYAAFSIFHIQFQNDEITKLKTENAALQKKIVDQKKLEDENTALRDQFQTNKPRSIDLLPAQVIGAPGFIPGASQPDQLIVNVGEKDGVMKGQAVVIDNNLVGKIERVSYNLSVVFPIQTSQTSFTARALKTNATGLVVPSNGRLQLGGVLLSDTLKKDDLVLTKGDVDAQGAGFPPDIVVGKIVNIDKRPSALFQTAEIQSLVDLSKIRMVFILRLKK